MSEDTAVIVYESVPDKLAWVIAAWLDAKARRSGSEGTREKYAHLFSGFCAYLRHVGLSIDGDATMIADAAQAWAGRSATPSAVARSTYNHRLAVLSSFYTFAVKRGHLSVNPIERIERGRVQEYAGARPLPFPIVQQLLAQIDRSTLIGARDYALLTLALFTGRRAAELAALNWNDFTSRDNYCTVVTWRRMKGGKTAHQVLPIHVTDAIDAWALMLVHEPRVPMQPDSPVWRSLSPRGTLTARRLAARSISLLYERRLGVSKVHVTRHTFAAAMEEAGAKVSEIQAALGHSSLATTGAYLHALKSDENPYADKLAALYGLGKE